MGEVDKSLVIALVCIPKTKHDHYDYLVLGDAIKLGSRVKVSFRHKICFGIVVGLSHESSFAAKLKPILEVCVEPLLITPDLLKFYKWIARYYHASLSDVMNLALPKKYKQGSSVIWDNSSKKLLQNEQKDKPLLLNLEQKTAVNTILMARNNYQTFLLQGVTGSGKTEVYLQVIEQILSENKQVLVLVPEIGLTPQLITRFKSRIMKPIVVIHSHLNDSERYNSWLQAAQGHAAVILGTRAALFTPIQNLGLIVIDEEHDASFKQQEGVRYSARDCAIMRAKFCKISIILGSATPSLESYYNVEKKKYKRLILSNKALTSSPLKYELIDLRAQPLISGLAATTCLKIEEHLKQGNQVLVFINRRGYAPVYLCHACGWMADCPACERHYTVHKKINNLICHHCGRQEELYSRCKQCASTELISLGLGTQKLYKTLTERFPHVVTQQIDRDTIKKKNALDDALDDIASHKTQLIVGTQLLAKGHHFPNLTLVIVVDVDASFYNQDFRALEKLGQLLLQVAGRAGRAHLNGEVLIQTHLPHHPSLNILIQQGYDAFARSLLIQRRNSMLPPYLYMGIVLAKGRKIENVIAFLQQLKQKIREELKIYGPAPAIIPKKAGLYRMQLCLVAPNRNSLSLALNNLKQQPIEKSGIKWHVDVDPIEL